MKKTLSTAIAALFLLQNLAFAQVNNTSDIINCSKNSEDSFCKSINITKEEIPLKSTLNQYYSGYLYTIENNGNSLLEITKIYDNKAPYAVDTIKSNRKELRFPKTLQAIIGLPLSGTILFPIFFMFQPYTIEGKKTSAFNYVYILPIKNTILAPYYLIKDPRNDEKAKKEVSQFNNNFKPLTIPSNDKVKLPILVGRTDCREGSGWSNYTGKVFIIIKDKATDKTYRIEK